MKTSSEMIKLFELANDDFLCKNDNLINSNVSERTLYGALLISIYELIKNNPDYNGYYVDVEYNRNNKDIRTILNNQLQVIKTNCDLIVHSRGENLKQDNLIAIEMKKVDSPLKAKNNNRKRLIALTKDSISDRSFHGSPHDKHVSGYLLGVYYEVNDHGKEVLIEYYIEGKKVKSYNKAIITS